MNSNFNKYASVSAGVVSYDLGLRQYMIAVYRYMALALLLTGVVAFAVSSSASLMGMIFGSPLMWLVMGAPVLMALWLGKSLGSMSVVSARLMFWIYSALMGLSLSSIFVMYTSVSITRTLLITASTFGVMSIYGQTTKRDLSGFGSFLFMGLIGLVISSVVNIFLRSDMMNFLTSAIGVLVFTGLTAFDAQRIKENYTHISSANGDLVEKASILSALSIYLDFINMFVSMLRFFGDRR